MNTNEFARILLTWIKSFLSWIGIPRDRLNELDEIIFLILIVVIAFDNVDVDKAGIGLSFSNTKTIGVSNCNLGGYVGVPSTASAKDGIFNK